MIKNTKINGYKIPVLVKDNGFENTVIMIHGFQSSYRFIGNIQELENNYNIISFSFPGSIDVPVEEVIQIETLIKVAKKILKKTRSKNIYLLGHSLGGLIASRIGNKSRIKGIFLLNSVHPEMINSKPRKALRAMVAPAERTGGAILSSLLKASSKMFGKDIINSVEKFTNEKTAWRNIVRNVILNDEVIGTRLNHDYLFLKERIYPIISKNDILIDTNLFISYMEKRLGKEVIKYGIGHSPMLKDASDLNKILNNIIEPKKRPFSKLRSIFRYIF